MANELVKPDLLTRHEFEDCTRMLLERKKAFFADDKRMVVNYKIVEKEDQHHLYVVSTLAED